MSTTQLHLNTLFALTSGKHEMVCRTVRSLFSCYFLPSFGTQYKHLPDVQIYLRNCQPRQRPGNANSQPDTNYQRGFSAFHTHVFVLLATCIRAPARARWLMRSRTWRRARVVRRVLPASILFDKGLTAAYIDVARSASRTTGYMRITGSFLKNHGHV